jgi:hypothetical protein
MSLQVIAGPADDSKWVQAAAQRRPRPGRAPNLGYSGEVVTAGLTALADMGYRGAGDLALTPYRVADY